MDSRPSFILLTHWNGEFKIVDNEVEYSLHANKAFVFDLDVSFEQVFNEFLTAVEEDGFNSIKKIWGKYPKYKDGVYAASRPFSISEERTWRCFIQKATNQYDDLEVYLEPHQVQEEPNVDDMEEEPQTFHHRQQFGAHQMVWDEAGLSNTALCVVDESDPDDPTYIGNSDCESSSSDESEVSGWLSICTPDVYMEEPTIVRNLVENAPSVHRNIEQVSLEPTFRVPQIEIGQTYADFKSLLFVVSLRNIVHHRHFRTSSKRKSYWLAKCSYSEQCPWLIQAAESSSLWTVKKYKSQHLCRPDYSKEKDDKLITSDLISGIIFSKIAADANYKVRYIVKDIFDLFRVDVTYKKCWLAKSIAIQRLYGSWEDSYNKLLPLLAALMQSNPGSATEIQMLPTTSPQTFQFMYVFWTFKASIDGFNSCFPVVSVDGTHLYGKYKGVLLIAVAMMANHEIFPLAYSLVDKEDGDSWSWFMMHLMRHAVPVQKPVCIISDRHGGIDVAFNRISQLGEQRVTRRYCLRHLRSNFQKKINSKKLKALMYHAASTPNVYEFHRTMQKIQTQRAEAYDWLMDLPLEKWALSYDGGFRHGILTTNLSESFNQVMKGCRSLPVYAIVKTTYERLVKLFAERRIDKIKWLQTGLEFPKYVWNEVRSMEDNRLHCHVIPHDMQQGIFRVTIDGNVGYAGIENGIIVNLSQRNCTCGKWSTFHMPCVHVYVVCRFCKITVDDFIPLVFSLQSYLNTYSGSVMPLTDEMEWPNLGYELVRPNAGQRSQLGRPIRTRFINNMDIRPRRQRRGM